MIIVSACLAGVNCRYNGKNHEDARIVQLVKEGKALPICPEQLGGLQTPRNPAEIKKETKDVTRVITKNGENVTEQFAIGAKETLRLCKLYNCKVAILKSLSPSCGSNQIYDGTFKKVIVEGDGLTARLLKENGIIVLTENDEKIT
jgi:uncharacterized protein YbbK (DUF523 family)